SSIHDASPFFKKAFGIITPYRDIPARPASESIAVRTCATASEGTSPLLSQDLKHSIASRDADDRDERLGVSVCPAELNTRSTSAGIAGIARIFNAISERRGYSSCR